MEVGRPTDYNGEISGKVCELIAEGYSLRQIGRIEGMPGKTTVLRWLARHEEFRSQYARARDLQAEHMADEILEIADDGTNDWETREQEGGGTITVVNHENIQRSRLRVDARKWLMSKMAPRKYGDRIAHTDGDGSPLGTAHMTLVTGLLRQLTVAPVTVDGTAVVVRDEEGDDR